MSTTMIERLETARMVCERLRREDLADLCRLLLDPRVATRLWPRPDPPSAEDIEHSLAARVDHWDRYGFGLWLLRDRETGEMVGRGGLQHTYASGMDEVEAGWAIVPARWGQGLATELAFACVEVGFAQLGLHDIIALAQPTNIASRRVMEKAGFAFERDVMYAQLPHMLYRCRRDDPGRET